MTASEGRGNQPPGNSLDFGSIELEGGGDPLGLDLDTSEKETTEPAAAPPAPEPEPQPQSPEPESAPAVDAEAPSEPFHKGHNPRYSPVVAPRRSYKKEITIAVAVLVLAGLIGGGVWGFMHWRQTAQTEKDAKMQALDQQSLDSLKNQATQKEKYGS